MSAAPALKACPKPVSLQVQHSSCKRAVGDSGALKSGVESNQGISHDQSTTDAFKPGQHRVSPYPAPAARTGTIDLRVIPASPLYSASSSTSAQTPNSLFQRSHVSACTMVSPVLAPAALTLLTYTTHHAPLPKPLAASVKDCRKHSLAPRSVLPRLFFLRS